MDMNREEREGCGIRGKERSVAVNLRVLVLKHDNIKHEEGLKLLRMHAKYSTVQYSTVQDSTVQ